MNEHFEGSSITGINREGIGLPLEEPVGKFFLARPYYKFDD